MQQHDDAQLARLDRPYKFLVVDDSAFARKNLMQVIQSMGGTVVGEASNGKEAVDKYFELHPDLTMMDISMPEMKGIEALRRIVERDAGARVIMVSSVGYEALIKEAIDIGAKHFVSKPFKAGDVARIIKFALGEEKELL